MQERKDRPPEIESAIAFPTAFPIKIMGRRESGFTSAVIEIVKKHLTGDFAVEAAGKVGTDKSGIVHGLLS